MDHTIDRSKRKKSEAIAIVVTRFFRLARAWLFQFHEPDARFDSGSFSKPLSRTYAEKIFRNELLCVRACDKRRICSVSLVSDPDHEYCVDYSDVPGLPEIAATAPPQGTAQHMDWLKVSRAWSEAKMDASKNINAFRRGPEAYRHAFEVASSQRRR